MQQVESALPGNAGVSRDMAEVTGLYRYPIKGLSPQRLNRMELTQGSGLAHDRGYALALGTTGFDPARPVPLAKTNFLMLARNEFLAGLATHFDDSTSLLTVQRDGDELARVDLATPQGREAAAALFTELAGDAAQGSIRVVAAAGHRFTDIGAPVPAMMNCVSLINLASVRALETAMGRALDPLRFRANIYVDGLEAWSEFDLIDRTLEIGSSSFRAVRRTRRCPATNVNLETAKRDADVPAALRQHFGHGDLGIYLAVESNGTLAPSDVVHVR